MEYLKNMGHILLADKAADKAGAVFVSLLTVPWLTNTQAGKGA